MAGLAPAPLATASLADALARLADRAGEESGLVAKFTRARHAAPGRDERGGGAAAGLPGSAGERAQARRASSVLVTLRYCDDRVRLEVTDDGAGFDPDLPSSGYGLRGMRARVSEIGGELTVRSAAGAGTTVTAEVP